MRQFPMCIYREVYYSFILRYSLVYIFICFIYYTPYMCARPIRIYLNRSHTHSQYVTVAPDVKQFQQLFTNFHFTSNTFPGAAQPHRFPPSIRFGNEIGVRHAQHTERHDFPQMQFSRHSRGIYCIVCCTQWQQQ